MLKLLLYLLLLATTLGALTTGTPPPGQPDPRHFSANFPLRVEIPGNPLHRQPVFAVNETFEISRFLRAAKPRTSSPSVRQDPMPAGGPDFLSISIIAQDIISYSISVLSDVIVGTH